MNEPPRANDAMNFAVASGKRGKERETEAGKLGLCSYSQLLHIHSLCFITTAIFCCCENFGEPSKTEMSVRTIVFFCVFTVPRADWKMDDKKQ